MSNKKLIQLKVSECYVIIVYVIINQQIDQGKYYIDELDGGEMETCKIQGFCQIQNFQIHDFL